MELIIAIAVIGVIGYVGYKVLNKEKEDGSHPLDSVTPAPYKIESPPIESTQPAAAKCGCGRSSSGLCVGLHKLSEEEWKSHPEYPKTDDSKAAKPKRGRTKKTTEQQ